MVSGTKVNSWISNDYSNFLRFCPPLKRKLYSLIARQIESSESNTILDYGCGEGNQIGFLNASKDIYLYDVNESYTSIAYSRNNKTHKLTQLFDGTSIRESYFDAIIVNMVWMCLQNESEIDDFLNIISKAKSKNGCIYLSITNPYSRDLDYSYYSTDYSNGKRFTYANNGEKFKVFIKDNRNSTFQDFHWTMEFTFSKIKEFGLSVESIINIDDEPYNNYRNKKVPPYQLLIIK